MTSGGSNILRSQRERILIFLLCLVAAARVFVFSAAFPFFSNIDEDLHFDLITQYSLARVPRSFDRLKEESLNWIVPYASPEFLFSPDQFPQGRFPAPLWKRAWSEIEPEIAATRNAWSGEINFESSQPPLYYALASGWWWMGKQMGLSGIQSLYWLRFLNVPLIALVVLLGYLAARAIAPERVELRLGVPLLLAFIPQNVFYALNNDVLSPVCCGALYLCVLRWLEPAPPAPSLGGFTGLAMAAAYLTKLSNVPMIVVAAVVVAPRLLQLFRQKPSAGLVALAGLLFLGVFPAGIWMAWLAHHFGDVTGSAAKIAFLDWTPKPLASWWRHPIFTPHGLWVFWSDLLASFWRGEAEWHHQLLDWPVADGFYVISSLVLLLGAVFGLWRKQSALSAFQRKAMSTALLMVAAGIVFLALLSIQFDFGRCINPSREHPYFTSGRLLGGALIPFALVYVYGVSVLFRRISAALPCIVLGIIVMFVSFSEIKTNWPVFASQHNWYHR